MRRRLGASVLAVLAAAGCSTGAATGPARRAPHRPRQSPVAAVATASFPDRLRGVHSARQLITVTAPTRHTTHARVRGWGRQHGHWVRRFGPWPARIGYNGFARRNHKYEGDGRTPTGSFRVPFMFGVHADPGVRFRYRRARSTSRWDDDPTSARYNRWVDIRRGDPGADPEHMDVLPQYRFGLVIGYNWGQVPGRGSGIFLHVTHHRSTLGCVAIRRHRVVRLLRWLRPTRHPRVIMGTVAAVTR